MYETLTPAPPDAILALSVAFRADPRPSKIDLSVGVYRDARGRTPVMAAVREAEQRLYDSQDSKAYVGLVGDEGFNAAITGLVFGADGPADRIRAVQSPGGCGALRVLADLLHRAKPGARVWLSDPTWPNHQPLMAGAGLELRTYPYFDPATKGVRRDAMLETFRSLGPDDVVLLHGACHNPTGAELTPSDWQAIADLAVERGFFPFVDFAYQGFGDGLEEDAAGVRLLAGKVPQMAVASSCSKNFGLYRERVGCAFLLGETPEQADTALSNLLTVARATYSMPPDHGGAVARIILEDAELRQTWEGELAGMRTRMLELRTAAADALRARSNSDAFDFIARHRGMFSLVGITVDQVSRLREDHAVYMVGAGRMNVAGLTEAQVGAFADALMAVTRAG